MNLFKCSCARCVASGPERPTGATEFVVLYRTKGPASPAGSSPCQKLVEDRAIEALAGPVSVV
jgi:hypothetical protein